MSGKVLIYSKCFVIWRDHFQNPVGGRLYVIPKAGQSTHQNKSQTPLSSQPCAATLPVSLVTRWRFLMNSPNGYSLTKLLVVLALLGVLSALALSTLYPAMMTMLYGG